MTITALLDRVFPAIASMSNQPMQYVTTKTVAYIFALVIDCVTVFHQVSPHSRALQHEASILQELNSMPPDDFGKSSAVLSPISTRTSSRKPALGDVPLPCPCPAGLSPKAASLPAPDSAAGADGDDNKLWYLEPTPTPLRRRRALRRRKPQLPPSLRRRHQRLPGGGVPAEAVASPRLLD